MTFPVLLPVTVCLAQAAGGVPPRGAPLPPPPEATVQGYRFVVERIQQAQNVSVEYAESGGSKTTGRQMVYLTLAVYPPSPGLAANIERLEPRLVAFAGPGTPVAFEAYTADEGGALQGGVWRASLTNQDLPLSVGRLERLQGELLVYPQARRARQDVPLDAALPAQRAAEGVRITLRRTRMRAGLYSVGVDLEYPESMQVARLNAEAPDGITAVSRAGTPLFPRREGVNVIRTGGMVRRQLSLVFSDLTEAPAALRFEALVRSGKPRQIPFVLPPVPLPDTLNLEAAIEASEGTAGPLQEGHPLFDLAGGSLQAPPRPARQEGRPLIGLARREGGEFGPVRWLEAIVAHDGAAVLHHLRPGRYRVLLTWPLPLGSPGSPGAPPAEVEVTTGKNAVLPGVRP